jgi:magnesium transporter
MMDQLKSGFQKYEVNTDLQHSLRDVEDHVERVISRANSFRDLLQNALTLDGTLTANRQNEASAEQNEQVKKISSWAAIFFAPSYVAGVNGMNFDHMPELHWVFGYPMAIGLMAGMAALMYVIFKRKGWL